MKSNVMIITPCFGYGGLERVVIDIIEEIDREKYNISFCTLLKPHPEMYDRIKNTGIPLYVIEKRKGIDIAVFFKLINILRKENVNIINTHDIGATLYAFMTILLMRRIKIVHTDHSQILVMKKYLWIVKYVLRNYVDLCITVSDDLKNILVKRFGVNENKIETIPNGINTEKFKCVEYSSKIMHEFKIENGEYIIGSVGRLTEQKGYEYLLKAMNILLAENKKIRLIIVGDGELRSSLKDLAIQLGIDEKVIFTGNRADIPEILKIFDVFVLSSLWEGQPISIIEAMASGKPIVVTDVGGNAEILGRGKYGVLVEPRNPSALAHAVKKVLYDKELASRLAKDASTVAENNLSRKTMTAKYEKIFATMIKN